MEKINEDLKAGQLNNYFNSLNEVAKTLTLQFSLEQMLGKVMDTIVSMFKAAETGVVLLWDQSSGLFRVHASIGYDKQIMSQLGIQAKESISGKVFENGEALLLNQPQEIQEWKADMRFGNRLILSKALNREPTPLCSLVLPIKVGVQKFGVLALETYDGPEIFIEDDVVVLQSIADLIGLAIERIRLQSKADRIRVVEETDRLRSEVTATLSHELRLPLTAIKGYSTALLMEDIEWDEQKKKDFLNRIDEEVDGMQSMIKDILDSSIIDVGQMKLEFQPVRLQILAREIMEEIQNQTKIHQLVMDIPENLPIVEVDPRWIKQVFRNILENAIKYSPDGGLIVIRGEKREADVVIRIADQGIGISPEDLIPLFEKFFRVRSSSDFHVSGTGLGLPVARSIVESHGGRIWAESSLGQGTTLNFSIPLSDYVNEKDE